MPHGLRCNMYWFSPPKNRTLAVEFSVKQQIHLNLHEILEHIFYSLYITDHACLKNVATPLWMTRQFGVIDCVSAANIVGSEDALLAGGLAANQKHLKQCVFEI